MHEGPPDSRVAIAADDSPAPEYDDEPAAEPTPETTPPPGESTTTLPEPVTAVRRTLRTVVPPLPAVPPLPGVVAPNCPPTPPPYAPSQLGVHSVSTAGGDGRLVIPHSDNEPQAISYSPDGRSIAYTRSSTTGVTMHIANADGSGERSLEHKTQSPYHVAWGPDGRHLAYTSQVQGTQEWALYLYELATGAVSEVHRHPGAGLFRWSPDGTRIAFYFNGDNEPGVWVADVGKAAVKVAGDKAWDLSWSPDGARLAIGTPAGGPAWVFDRDGANRRQAHPRGLRVAWSPVDASKLAVDQSGITVLVDLAAGTSRHVAAVHLHGWLPDGSKLVGTTLGGIHLVALDGCLHTLVPFDGSRVGLRAWTPDSKTILFSNFA